ncbi:sulfotransferase family protein [Antribacter gilvus]|uniref:sulfotransferase family protein n=1 Tax=Antribacter gilvus TaxID=2304675 RepID=UPI000F7A2C0E|nr:sulfotransferase [Antribacter gilvus]
MSETAPLLRLLNVVLAPGLRTRKDPDAVFARIVADAQRRHAPLTADDLAGIDGLRLLLTDHAGEPDLSAFGWKGAQDQVRSRVLNRAVVRQVQAQRPGVRDEPVDAPVFVVGLARTGTTLTYNLIARSPGSRGPRLWEMTHLGPPRPEAERARLIEQTHKRYAVVAKLNPAWADVHPLIPESEEEDFFLRAHSELYCTSGTLPRYLEHLAGADLTDDYLFLRDALQVIAAGEAPDRWVLKHPADLWRMPEILRAFPGARFVWTHRSPGAAVASGCSMAEAARRIFLKPGRVDLEQIGRDWLAVAAAGVDRALAQRAGLPEDAVVDVVYDDLVAAPETVMRGVFDRLGMPWGEADDANLAAALDRTGHRGHRYTLERYGLDEAKVAAAFADYRVPASVLR